MNCRTISGGMGVLMLLGLAAGPTFADESKNAIIAHSESAAPSYISREATIMLSDGTVLREGSDGWTCLPDTMSGDTPYAHIMVPLSEN